MSLWHIGSTMLVYYFCWLLIVNQLLLHWKFPSSSHFGRCRFSVLNFISYFNSANILLLLKICATGPPWLNQPACTTRPRKWALFLRIDPTKKAQIIPLGLNVKIPTTILTLIEVIFFPYVYDGCVRCEAYIYLWMDGWMQFLKVDHYKLWQTICEHLLKRNRELVHISRIVDWWDQGDVWDKNWSTFHRLIIYSHN